MPSPTLWIESWHSFPKNRSNLQFHFQPWLCCWQMTAVWRTIGEQLLHLPRIGNPSQSQMQGPARGRVAKSDLPMMPPIALQSQILYQWIEIFECQIFA